MMALDPHTNEFGGRMLKLFCLPEGTIWFELRCAVNEAVTVKGQFYLEHGDELLDFLNQYDIIKKGPK